MLLLYLKFVLDNLYQLYVACNIIHNSTSLIWSSEEWLKLLSLGVISLAVALC